MGSDCCLSFYFAGLQKVFLKIIYLHYVTISVLINLCHFSVIPSYILSIVFMNFIQKLLILYKRKLHMHKIYPTKTKRIRYS